MLFLPLKFANHILYHIYQIIANWDVTFSGVDPGFFVRGRALLLVKGV
jgi:hypothetical protein